MSQNTPTKTETILRQCCGCFAVLIPRDAEWAWDFPEGYFDKPHGVLQNSYQILAALVPNNVWLRVPGLGLAPGSHGYCPECFIKQMALVEAQKVAHG